MVNLTENSLHVLKERYLRKNKKGNVVETPEQMFERVVNAICDTPELKNRILNYLKNLDFLPNSPTLMNSGTDMSQLSACFTIEIKDNLKSIFDGVKHTALIFQTGGGVGATFEHIRPKGSIVKSTQGVASGPISFMSNYNIATETIKQGGKRRGAFMAILSVSHPDIFEFIDCKDKGNTLSNMNISVSITDEFMKCVEDDLNWNLFFDGKNYKTVKAKDIFNKLVEHAHYCGDPGVLFIDTINRNNKGEWIEQVNPCSEQPLLPYESCNLGSIKISNFVKDKKIDWNSLKNCIFDVVEFLDLIIDNNNYSDIILEEIPQIKQKTLETRKIGLGLMGWADALIFLNISYNSDEAYNLAEKTMKFIHECAFIKSVELAKTKGSFPKFKEYYLNNDSIPLRNANLTTIAPTGSLSVIANCSSGIEPIYSIVYKRNLKNTIGKDLYEINDMFLKMAKERNFYSEELIEKISNNNGSIQSISEIPEDIRKLFVTAHDISYKEHIMMQSSFQKYTQSGISKTINLPNSATVSDVYNSYIFAWKSGCKGVTVYRDGSKEHQVFTSGDSKDKQVFEASTVENIGDMGGDMGYISKIRPIDDLTIRPDILPALSFTKKTACNTLFFNITHYGRCEKDALESFIDTNGGCLAMRNGIAITISVYQRILETISPEFARRALEIVTQHLIGVSCPACTNKMIMEKQNISKIRHPVDSISCPSALGKVLEFMLTHKIETTIDGVPLKFDDIKANKNIIGLKEKIGSDIDCKKCPECGSQTIRQEGCMNDTCIVCGWGGCI